jgi:hypothetical protein
MVVSLVTLTDTFEGSLNDALALLKSQIVVV